MGYIGNTPAEKFQTLEKQSFSVSATTGYTLSHAVTSPQDIALFINNVRQNPNSSYSVSGTALTLSAATASGDTMYCVFLGKSVGTIGVPAGGVGTSQIIDANITTAKIADNAVTNAKLANSAITLNGSAVSLGGSATIGGGKIGQLVTMTHSTSVTTTSGSFQDSGATLNITPSATSSKVFVIAQVNCGVTRSNAESYMSLGIIRASTQLFTQAAQGFGGYIGNSNAYQNFGIQTLAYVDSPSSTSQLTYKINFKASAGNAIVQYGSTPTILTLMEVLA